MKRFLLVLALFGALLGLRTQALSAHRSHPVAERVYVVQPGDTLWRIASTMPGDRRESVYRLMQLNRLAHPDLRPGQRLTLPSR